MCQELGFSGEKQDLILEFMQLLLDNRSKEPTYLIMSAKFQYGMPKLDGYTCFTF